MASFCSLKNINNIKVFYSEINGLTYEDWLTLLLHIYNNNWDVVILNGVLRNSVSIDNVMDYEIPGYSLLTADMVPDSGIFMYMIEKIHTARIVQGDLLLCPCSLWVILDKTVLLGIIYMSNSCDSPNLDGLRKSIIESVSLANHYSVVIGNFHNHYTESINDIFRESNYRSCFTTETNSTRIFSNVDVHNIYYKMAFGLQRNYSLSFNFDHKPTRELSNSMCFGDAEYEELNNFLRKIDWDKEFNERSASQAFNIFKKHIHEGSKECVSRKPLRPEILPRWMRSKIDRFSRLLKEAVYAWITANNSPSELFLEKCAKLHDEFTKQKKAYEKKCKAANMQDWLEDYIKCDDNNLRKITHVKDMSGKIVYTEKEIVAAFGSFFASTYKRENTPPDYQNRDSDSVLELLEINDETVINELKLMKVSKAWSPGGIHPNILNNCSETIGPVLAKIFRKSMKQEPIDIPDDWKLAQIFPKHKKDDIYDVKNYRPISVTNNVVKVFEKIILNHIKTFMIEKDIFSPYQHGSSVSNKSRITNLFESFNIYTESLDNGTPVDILYLDISKAYDTVPHHRLLVVLSEYGINKELLYWLVHYLVGRESYVYFLGERSQTEKNISGIPQGSVLSNLLFSIFVNRIPNLVNCLVQMYCDDIKLISPLNYKDGEYYSTLQDDLNKLTDWCKQNNMTFNLNKCKVMHLGSNNPKTSYSMCDFSGDGRVVLQETELQSDLGIMVDNKLNFDEHIKYVLDRAQLKFTIIQKRFTVMWPDAFLVCFNLVRSVLESAGSVWCPTTKKQEDQIEALQRDATATVEGMGGLSYEERLQKLKLPSLKFRRKRMDLIQMFRFAGKYAVLNTDIPWKEYKGKHSKTLEEVSTSKPLRNNFFFNRVSGDWNSLSENTVNAKDVDEFEQLLDKEFKKDMFTYQFE